MTACTREIYWYYYIAVSLISFFGGLLILIPARIIWYALYQEKSQPVDYVTWKKIRNNLSCLSRIRAHASYILSGHTQFSKAVILCVWLVNMASVILYLVEATLFEVDDCGEVQGDNMQYVWLAFSGFFILNYIIRLVAASDKCFMWVDLYSIVDHFTIGPLFVGLYLNRNWLGLRFLRLLYILQIPDILQLVHLIKSRGSIRLVQVASIFASIWLCSSGFVHISENNGDPFHNYSNAQSLTYWECVYWLLVTMSTVGFGEISPSTDIGRAFIVVFIMGSFAMFTTIIPELAHSLGRSSKYHEPYKRTYGKKHIVVCGHITKESVSNFIKNFIHEDSASANIDVVFVDRSKPGLELEAFFKRHFNDVKFVQGTVMDIKTLQGVKLRFADACLILANRAAANPNGEDGANIMRATAVKNYNPSIRVIIQILQYRNKMNLLHIPNWRWDESGGDEVICISELKNGILAQNCVAPGISTLLSNLFTMRSSKRSRSTEWADLYKAGSGNEIYAQHFSSAFVGMSFPQAVSTCFSQFGLLLVAVYVQERTKLKLKVNPGSDIAITESTVGFFIAQNPAEVKKVTTYCGELKPHRSHATHLLINGKPSPEKMCEMEPLRSASTSSHDEGDYLEYLENARFRVGSEISLSGSNDELTQHKDILDVTGMFHYCFSRDITTAILDADSARVHQFKDHIIVCLNGDEGAPEAGLVNFITPLRSSSFKSHELLDIVIVGNPSHVAKEWSELTNLPKVYIFPHGKHMRTDLRSVNIHQCAMCVIMTVGGSILVDHTLIDKDAVLTTLTIKSMFGATLENRIKTVGVLTNPEAFRREMAVTGEIPTITELEHDCNVAFVDVDDDDDPTVPIYMTAPYACGRAFVVSVLDSLVSSTYLNGDILTLVRALITGGETAEFEKILSEGLGIVRKDTLIDVTSARPRCRLAQLSLACGPLDKLKHNDIYGQLFTDALETFGILCLGIYRLMDPSGNDPRDRKRVVICNPEYELRLFAHDRVFVLQPHEIPYGHPSCDHTIVVDDVSAHTESQTKVAFTIDEPAT